MTQPLSIDTLLKQKRCCGNGCSNCPYVDAEGKRHITGSTHTFCRLPHRSHQDEQLIPIVQNDRA